MIYAKKVQIFSILENLKKGYKFEKIPKKWKNILQMAQNACMSKSTLQTGILNDWKLIPT